MVEFLLEVSINFKVSFVIRYIILLFLLFFNLLAYDITSKSDSTALLPYAKIYIAKKDISFNLIKNKHFKQIGKHHINFGFNPDDRVWVKFALCNKTDNNISKVLLLDNPLLEKVIFYSDKNGYIATKGLLGTHNVKVIMPSVTLNLKPHEKITFYINIVNKTTTLEFGLYLKSKKLFLKQDKFEQNFILFFLGLLCAFIVYSLFLFLYTKNKSYALYSFYLFMLLFQQMTYIGYLPMYAPSWFTRLDNLMVVPKISLMIIAAALFAKSFLKTYKFKIIDNIYNIFIYTLIVLMPIVGAPYFYKPVPVIIIGFLFVLFNTYSGIYIYKHGNKQARFFILGWIFLIIGYVVMIFDSLGLFSAMYKFPELIMFLTFLEALFLLLAFVDEINILTDQKNLLTKKLIDEMYRRHELVEEEVKIKTKELKNALEDKVILLREVNHRVKNNLQMILSILRLQKNDIDDTNSLMQLTKLENRINAISKTHQILCQNSEFNSIEMYDYIYTLCNDIKKSYDMENISIEISTNVSMSLKKAVYVGLVINELISNSLKHAFKQKNGKIMLELSIKNDSFLLEVHDNGTKKSRSRHRDSLGLSLIQALVEKQLAGELKYKIGQDFWYIIEFPKEQTGE